MNAILPVVIFFAVLIATAARAPRYSKEKGQKGQRQRGKRSKKTAPAPVIRFFSTFVVVATLPYPYSVLFDNT